MSQMNVMIVLLASALAAVSAQTSTQPEPPEDYRLGPQVPQTQRRFLRWLGYQLLRLFGWQIRGAMPNLPRFIVVVAPHTSNWDFIVALLAKWALGITVRFVGKDTLFIPPLGWFMRSLGGIPVVRSQRNNIVEQSIREFATRDQFVLVLAPEGTRKRVTEWKSGFWHIAHAAHVPICCVALDYGRKIVRIGPTFDADDVDVGTGVARVRSAFVDVTGYDPRMQT